ncbi:MAG: hypothetical protein KJ614_00095 [Gammaproteobacteria bacterium]|uniref:hypothetical protein n=1 Tax=Rhodoferax sp. TaxID=50421 RepID=UPI001DDD3D7F|nr:hypothetical protein [Rhodoferax sp.]MBU3897325.1 hypothetical protein [Gammaproteobacteria bacterium]MBU3998293.1 hypothetical protein [Gammaproteobacteria bacterium]MBU4018671.1 hypothetical protein [Gammaproteobacteria bacterium]MBU4079626.1 hypothetical protein [Gammaproteobacteria bacterium]MBU4112118.1 hypothetical protein [Gammaproteobacteria bacterium]
MKGLPLWHEVFDSNAAEVSTIKGVIETIVAGFPMTGYIRTSSRQIGPLASKAQTTA